jgi:hypothetical protein
VGGLKLWFLPFSLVGVGMSGRILVVLVSTAIKTAKKWGFMNSRALALEPHHKGYPLDFER